MAFFYDPNWSQSELINNNLSTNKQYFKVVDIQETQLVEFTVKWAYPRPWSKTVFPPIDLVNPSVISVGLADYTNGYIGVTPFNLLQSPDDSSVAINVYVYSDNLQVNYLNEYNILGRSRPILTESLIWDPEEIVSLDLNESTAQTSTICLEYFGEQPVSFRSLVKRFATSQRFDLALATSDWYRFSLVNTIIPPLNDPYAAGSTAVEINTLFDYLRYAYMGLRGGMRHRLRFLAMTANNTTDHMVVRLRETSTSTTVQWTKTNSASFRQNPMSYNGSVAYIPFNNAGFEFELPMYTNNLFLFSFADDLVGTNGTSDMEEEWVRAYEAFLVVGDNAQKATTLEVDVAAGEDFSFMRFQGAPYYYYS